MKQAISDHTTPFSVPFVVDTTDTNVIKAHGPFEQPLFKRLNLSCNVGLLIVPKRRRFAEKVYESIKIGCPSKQARCYVQINQGLMRPASRVENVTLSDNRLVFSNCPVKRFDPSSIIQRCRKPVEKYPELLSKLLHMRGNCCRCGIMLRSSAADRDGMEPRPLSRLFKPAML